MSNILTDWRKAIVAYLQANLTDLNGNPFTVVSGERDGVSRDRNIACVFSPKFTADEDLNYGHLTMLVRAWVRMPKQVKTTSPLDPEPVEQLMVDLAAALKQIQRPADLGIDLAFSVTEITPDYPDQGVQATLEAWLNNPGGRNPL